MPPEQVSKEWDAIANNYARHARIPGYRPGKAPRQVIEAKFRKEIQDELTKKLVSKSYHEAIAQETTARRFPNESGGRRVRRRSLDAFSRDGRDRAGIRAAGLQEHSGAVAGHECDAEAEIDAAVERLRDQSADFVDVPERGLAMEDFAVIDFEGTIDGKPISEIAPEASKNLQGGKKFWLRMAADNFLPQFCEQIVGHEAERDAQRPGGVSGGFPVAGAGRQNRRTTRSR